MDMESVSTVAAAVGVAVGMGLVALRARGSAGGLGGRVRAELAKVDSASLPELAARLGMSDGFMSRGKLMQELQPMVSAGEVLQDEPAGTTVRDRLAVVRFRLRRDASVS
jgi:hypothetical protein